MQNKTIAIIGAELWAVLALHIARYGYRVILKDISTEIWKKPGKI